MISVVEAFAFEVTIITISSLFSLPVVIYLLVTAVRMRVHVLAALQDDTSHHADRIRHVAKERLFTNSFRVISATSFLVYGICSIGQIHLVGATAHLTLVKNGAIMFAAVFSLVTFIFVARNYAYLMEGEDA